MAAFKAVTVLLVDDVHLYLELEKTFLRRHDVRVLTSGQGPQVLALAKERRPDVVVVDVRSPEPEGLLLCRTLKTDTTTRDIPVIMVTARHLRGEAEKAGADALVYKPIAQRAFLDAIRRFVELRERRHIRYPVNLRFIFSVGNEVRQAFSRDLSLTGAFLNTDKVVSPGSALNLRFRLPGEDEAIECRGIVRNNQVIGRRGAPSRGFGVEFQEIGRSELQRLEAFIEKHQSRPVPSR